MANKNEVDVLQAMEWFGVAESSLSRARQKLVQLSGIFAKAYKRGNIQGGASLKLEDEAFVLAGEVAALHSRVIVFHEKCTAAAKAANIDQPGDYEELGPVDPDVIQTRSGGR